MDKETKIQKIYEIIADKTLSFGCMVKYKYETENESGEDIALLTTGDIGEGCAKGQSIKRGTRMRLNKYKIIGHPIYIGDVLDWIQQTNSEPIKLIGGYSISDIHLNLWHLWYYKRKPIDDQDDSCIDFIYNLLQDDR